MKIIANEEALGSVVKLKTSNPLHFSGMARREEDGDDISTSFGDMLKSALGKVNNLQVESDALAGKMVYDPGSVDIHTVMIAAQKAELALNFTKAVRDEAIRAYRELMMLR
jgi:flagellar hook-basal body complex protein FliE